MSVLEFCMPPCCVPVQPSTVGVVVRCGRVSRTMQPGLRCICWPAETVVAVPTKFSIQHCKTDTKTRDGVSVCVTTAVQYTVDPAEAHTFMFKATSISECIEAFVDNAVRSRIPGLNLEAAFEEKDGMAQAMLTILRAELSDMGLHVRSCVMTDILPDKVALAAMNEAFAARMRNGASLEAAETEMKVSLQRAETAAEAARLSGVGAASMRKAMAGGLRESVQELQLCGLDTREACHAVLAAAYTDTLRDFATHGNSAVVMAPSTAGDIDALIRTGFMQATMSSKVVKMD